MVVQHGNFKANLIYATILIVAMALLPFWPGLPSFIANLHIADSMALSGIILTIAGFVITILQIFKVRSATDAALDAVVKLENNFELFEVSNLCESCLRVSSEIQRFHDFASSSKTFRMYSTLSGRYRELIPLLVQFREHLTDYLTDDQKSLIQMCITKMRATDNEINRAFAMDSEARLPSLQQTHKSTGNVHELITAIFVQFQRKALTAS